MLNTQLSLLAAYFKSTKRSQQTNSPAIATIQFRIKRLVQRVLTVIAQSVMRGPSASITPVVPDGENGCGGFCCGDSPGRRIPKAKRDTATSSESSPKPAIMTLLLLLTCSNVVLP